MAISRELADSRKVANRLYLHETLSYFAPVIRCVGHVFERLSQQIHTSVLHIHLFIVCRTLNPFPTFRDESPVPWDQRISTPLLTLHLVHFYFVAYALSLFVCSFLLFFLVFW